MVKKRMRMFAGPNGAGKSELIRELKSREIPLGSFVNADDIAKQLEESGFIDLFDYKLKNITQDDWKQALVNIPELISRVQNTGTPPNITIRENTLVCQAENLSSYSTALIADFLRYMLVSQSISFSFETVMSHNSKVTFLDYVKSKGYTAYLYFIATESPDIHVERVKNRVAKGGHNVPEEKIRDRYYKSLELLFEALKTADRAFLVDNSKKSNFVILEKKYDGLGYPLVYNMPDWFMKYVMEKLESE